MEPSAAGREAAPVANYDPAAVTGLLIVLGATIVLLGLFLTLLGASDLEADWINVGRLVGRHSSGPRVSTTAVGIACLAAGTALIVVARAFRRAGRPS